MATGIIINDEIRQEIFKVVEYAYKNVVPLYKMAENGKLKKGMPNPIAGDDGFIIIIPNGFKVIFSIEDQGSEKKGERGGLGKCRHLSMSINKKGRIPNPIAVDMVMEEFGFDNPFYHCAIWSEGFGGNTQIAINVLEPINGWPDKEHTLKMLKENCTKMFEPLFGNNLVEAIDRRRNILRSTDELGTSETEGGRANANLGS